MKIVESGDSFELHIESSVTDNIVNVKGNVYTYKRLVIPGIIIDYFSSVGDVEYLFLYFSGDHVFLSCEKIPGLKYSKRKLVKHGNKYSYFINLNKKSLDKHNITLKDKVVFIVGSNECLNSDSNISIELLF